MRKLVLTVIVVYPEQFIPKKKLIIYTKAFVKLYN